MPTESSRESDLQRAANEALIALLATARDAFRRQAFHQATAELRQALQVIATSPPATVSEEFALACHLSLGTILGMTYGHSAPEVKAIYESALELCIPRSPETALVLRFQMAMQHGLVSEARLAAHAILENAGTNPSLRLAGLLGRGWPLLMEGHPAEAVVAVEEARDLLRTERGLKLPEIMAEHPWISAGGLIAMATLYQGGLDSALRLGLANLEEARQSHRPYDELHALAYVIGISKWRREWEATRDYAERAIAHSKQLGVPYWSWYCSLDHGWALYHLGEVDRGTAEIEESGAQLEVVGARLIRTIYRNQMSYVLLQRGQYHLAQDLLLAGVADAQRRGERLYLAESHRMLGVIAEAVGDRERARAAYAESLAISRGAGARLFELSTLASLARLMAAEGRGHEATQLLRPAYDGFKEGRDTPFLQAIATQLEDL